MQHLAAAYLDASAALVWRAQRIGAIARDALLAELNTWPKPGLVSHVDSGSHTDMDARSIAASAEAIGPFFSELVDAGADGAGMAVFRAIGLRAEYAMMAATGGSNAHRGAIFGLGLLCAAAGAIGDKSGPEGVVQAADVAHIVQARWGPSILQGPIPVSSHGGQALRRFGAGGARAEAAAGFPHVMAVALPALRRARVSVPADPEAWRVQAFFALLAKLDDTNLLHRGGTAGLCFAQNCARQFLAQGGVLQPLWRDRAAGVHRAFVARRLSPGGCADLLAITLFLDTLGTGD